MISTSGQFSLFLMGGLKRRRFVAGASLLSVGMACGRRRDTSAPAGKVEERTDEDRTQEAAENPEKPLERRALGSTGVEVSMLGLGGAHLGVPDENESIRIMHRAIEEGLTFFDNCWSYHDGESERRMGKALAGGKREQVFLMTKIDGRIQEAASQQIDLCLQRLRTDHVDLMQIHEVIREKDPSWVFRDDGAIRALLDAKQAGKIRYIGFTGHKSPEIHLQMLRVADEHGFRFDAVQMPLNCMDPHFDSFEKKVLPVLVDKKMGVLGMKSLASGAILEDGVVTAPECLRYALSLPTSVVITGCKNMDDLEQALDVGRRFQPLSTSERSELLARTAARGRTGKVEEFKTAETFDGTTRNPHWLTTAEL